MNKKILVTGSAGFIGFHLSKKLCDDGWSVTGLDNINDYYDIKLKNDRLEQLKPYNNFSFLKADLADKDFILSLFEKEKFDYIVNLAAQAGVRYSLKNPYSYITSNISGFINILEACRNNPVKHLVYASSSSVYGANTKIPFSVHHNVDHPLSLYAATKKANELMAHTYSNLFGIPTTGLRFFTVYGPWGRPDMAAFLFTKAITEGKPIKVFNNGDLYRDFTYINDIVEGIANILNTNRAGESLYRVYNIGNSSPVKLMDFIETIEKALGTKAVKEFMEMQPGDVYKTYADVTDLEKDYNYRPDTPLA